jgi:hypothetical protein
VTILGAIQLIPLMVNSSRIIYKSKLTTKLRATSSFFLQIIFLLCGYHNLPSFLSYSIANWIQTTLSSSWDVIFTCCATCIATHCAIHFATCVTLLHGQSLELHTLYWALCTLPIYMQYTYHKHNKWKHVKSTMKTFGRIILGIIKRNISYSTK